MPKKTAKKRTGRPVRRKKSFFESLFSFSMPKMFAVVAAAVFLTLMFQFNSTSQLVLGTKETSETLTQTQVDALPKSTAPAYSFPKYVRTQLIRDRNGNGKIDGSDSCLSKKYSFRMNGKDRSVTQPSDCSYMYTLNKSKDKCTEVKFINTLSNYTFSGIIYSDGKNNDKGSKSKTVSVCGTSGTAEGVNGGFVYSEVNFLIKPK